MSQELEKVSDTQIEGINVEVAKEILTDLERALNLIIQYQRTIKMLTAPDPSYVEARRMLIKYKMISIEPSQVFKVYADGVDITLHPDSIQASADEMAIEGPDEYPALEESNE